MNLFGDEVELVVGPSSSICECRFAICDWSGLTAETLKRGAELETGWTGSSGYGSAEEIVCGLGSGEVEGPVTPRRSVEDKSVLAPMVKPFIFSLSRTASQMEGQRFRANSRKRSPKAFSNFSVAKARS